MEHYPYSNSSDSATIPVFRPPDLQKPTLEPELPVGGRTRRNRIGVLLLFSLLTAMLFYGAFWTRFKKAGSPVIAGSEMTTGVLPGDFEDHEAILICWPGPNHPLAQIYPKSSTIPFQDAVDQLLVGVIEAIHKNVRTVCLVSNKKDHRRATGVLHEAGIPSDRIQFVEVSPVDFWARDFGPLIMKSFDGSYQAVDADYYTESRLNSSETVTPTLARLFDMKTRYAPLFFEGGNLLSNGAGLCLTTDRLVFWNELRHNKPEISKLLKDIFGANEVIYLEQLDGEGTGHVDMFAAFTAPDTVVIGKCSPEVDPVNAAILDRNAKRLVGLKTACGPLKVERVPLFRRTKDIWHSYTNVVFANGILLVPTYSNADPELQEQALSLYRRLLPGWKVVELNSDLPARYFGSLHCITQNLYRISNPVPAEE